MEDFVVVHRVSIKRDLIQEFEDEFKEFQYTTDHNQWSVKLSLFVKEFDMSNVYMIITLWGDEQLYKKYLDSEERTRFDKYIESHVSTKRYHGSLLQLMHDEIIYSGSSIPEV